MMRKIAIAALSAALVAGLIGGAAAAPKPVKVWTDGTGDADVALGTGASIPAGFDLVEGSIAKDGADLVFTVTHADMPPAGSAPEATRFLWNFTVDGKPFRLTAKSFDVGKPDALAQSGTERVGKVGPNHFRLEGECATDNTLPVGMVNCPVVGYLDGSFDAASLSFSVKIPLKVIKAKTGSKIAQGPANICNICWVTHYAERSLNSTIIDDTAQTVTYKVPR